MPPMKFLTRVHRYLSCFIAPAMIFFAVSGAWQAFRLQDTRKDGSYQAPPVLSKLSKFHTAGLKGPARFWLQVTQVVLGAAFLLSAGIGSIMAVRLTRPAWLAWVCLAAGVALPVVSALLVWD